MCIVYIRIYKVNVLVHTYDSVPIDPIYQPSNTCNTHLMLRMYTIPYLALDTKHFKEHTLLP